MTLARRLNQEGASPSQAEAEACADPGSAGRPRGWGVIVRSVLRTARDLRQDKPTVGQVFDRLGPEGLGIALLLLTLPTLIPVPGPLGMIFGALIAIVALQIMVGLRGLWLPGFIRRQTLPSTILRKAISGAIFSGLSRKNSTPRQILRTIVVEGGKIGEELRQRTFHKKG